MIARAVLVLFFAWLLYGCVDEAFSSWNPFQAFVQEAIARILYGCVLVGIPVIGWLAGRTIEKTHKNWLEWVVGVFLAVTVSVSWLVLKIAHSLPVSIGRRFDELFDPLFGVVIAHILILCDGLGALVIGVLAGCLACYVVADKTRQNWLGCVVAVFLFFAVFFSVSWLVQKIAHSLPVSIGRRFDEIKKESEERYEHGIYP